MKIRSVFSLLVCGAASQFMVGCSSGRYFSFSTPATSYHKTPPIAEETTSTQADVQTAIAPEVAEDETNTAILTASDSVAMELPLTSSQLEKYLEADLKEAYLKREMAQNRKEIKAINKEIKRLKAIKKSRKPHDIQMHHYHIWGGLVFLAGGILVTVTQGWMLVGILIAILGLLSILFGLWILGMASAYRH